MKNILKKTISSILTMIMLISSFSTLGIFASEDDSDYPPFVDNSGLSDQEFFGVWDNVNNRWSTEYPGKLNYEKFDELSAVAEAAKVGDYETAKSEFLYYSQAREGLSNIYYNSTAFDKIRLFSDNVLWNDTQPFVATGTIKGNEYKKVTVDVSSIVRGRGSYGFQFVQRFKHEAAGLIMSKENKGFEPILELKVNGQPRTYKANKDTYLSPMENYDVNFGSEKELRIKETKAEDPENTQFGYLWTKDTSRPVIQFAATGMDKEDTVTEAKITFYAKVESEDPNAECSFAVFRENNTIWKENEYRWSVADIYIVSLNGEEHIDWNLIPGNEEHRVQLNMNLARMWWLSTYAGAYENSGDEYYAYHAIRHVMDMINSTTDYIGFFNLQDTGIRAGTLVGAYHSLLKSKYMDKEANTAIVKNLWQISMRLTLPDYFTPSHNHGVFSNRGLMRVTVYFPEFREYDKWKALFIERWNQLATGLINEDGTYGEATTSYAYVSLNNFFLIAQDASFYNFQMGEAFNERIKALARYLTHLMWADMTEPAYGDSDRNYYRPLLTQIADYYDMQDIKYILSYGEEGEHPGFTSNYYPGVNRYLVMRNNYNKDSMILHTNMGQGDGRSHTHFDNLSVVVYAYEQLMLADMGRYTYSNNEISNWIRYTTESHNTITITAKEGDMVEKINQGIANETPTYNMTNNGFDFFEGTTKTNKVPPGFTGAGNAYEHKRDIFFARNKFWVISDLVNGPTQAASTENTYDQNWHVIDGAYLQFDYDNKKVTTNFEESANIVVAQAKEDDSVLMKRSGYYAPSGSSAVLEVDYMTFQKQGTGTEKVAFNTVLFPKRAEQVADIDVTKIDLGVQDSSASALNIDVLENDSVQKNIYYISHDTPSERDIEKFNLDGKVFFGEYQTSGDLKSVSMVLGKKLTYKIAENNVVELINYSETQPLEDIYIYYAGDRLYIDSQAMTPEKLAELKVYNLKNASKVFLNNKEIPFFKDGNIVKFTSEGDQDMQIATELVNGRTVGTLADDYTNQIVYNHNGVDRTLKMTISKDTVVDGDSAWNGSLPKISFSPFPSVDAKDNINVGAIKFSSYDHSLDIPYQLEIQKVSDVKIGYIKNGMFNKVSKTATTSDVTKLAELLQQEEIVIANTADKAVVYSKKPYEIVLYTEKPPAPTGGSTGGVTVIPTNPTPTPTPTSIPTPTPTPTPTNPVDPSMRFVDTKGHWAQTDIDEMVEMGIVQGTSKTSFEPERNITRAEVAAIVSRLLGIETKEYKNKFSDVLKDQWFASVVVGISEAGIMNGYDGLFRPNDLITREEMSKVIIDAYEKKKNFLDADSSVLNQYTDSKSISPWANTYLAKAVTLQIMKGRSASTLVPKGNTTRAEAVVMIKRLNQMLQ